MKKLKVLVEKGDDGTYWGTTQNVPGVISTFGNSLEELKANTQVAFADYIETAEQCKEDWVNEVKTIEQVEFSMNIASFFRLVPQVKISAIAQKANINPSLMRQYATPKESFGQGKAAVSENRLKVIQNTLHDLGHELLSVKF